MLSMDSNPRRASVALMCLLLFPTAGRAQSTGQVAGTAVDETGGMLPGVTVELESARATSELAITDGAGAYVFDNVPPGTYEVRFTLLNFATSLHRDVMVQPGATTQVDGMLQLALNAEVTVIGRSTFTNLADVENPAENLVGVAQSASQGAITARQLDVRPIMRQGEVLETVPGVIITQHSGEGKANQYFLRGFNLDHGSDFAMTVSGTPVNMPTHAHSQGYADINFLIPELVAGVQFSKGPYFADQGDFGTAGSSNINYATFLDRPSIHVEKGTYGYGRVLMAVSPQLGRGNLLAAFETSTNAGPWAVPDSYRKLNGVLRYSQGDTVNGLSLTFMGYHGQWNATEAVPARAVDSGLIDRFGSIDPSDGGTTSRYAFAADWQRGGNATLTKLTAFGLKYDLDLISNFTYFLDDPVLGDQREQVDDRFVSGVKISQRRLTRWGDRPVQNTFGAQLRNDNVAQVALYHTENRVRVQTWSDASALVTSAGVYAQNEIEWKPWLRTMAGIRADGTRFGVDSKTESANSGTARAGIVSPKGGVTLGPWKGTEFYVNAGTGFHSNNALGTTVTYGVNGERVDRVTPLVRAKGAEAGMRTVAIPHLQSTVSLWTLRLGSELVYNGDIGATEPGPPSKRYGVEFANYYSPNAWLVFDGDISWSQARFAELVPEGPYVPEAVGVATLDGFKRMSGSARWRYFGSRTLIEDNSVKSEPTSLINLDAAYALMSQVRVSVSVFNLFNARDSDIDYFFPSRLPGEPLLGVDDIHYKPTIPRTVRVNLTVGF
jgi:hypothetical protein